MIRCNLRPSHTMVCTCLIHPFLPWTKWFYCSLTTLNSRLQRRSSHPPNVHLASTVFGPVTLMDRSSCLEVDGSNRMLTAWRYLLRPTVVFVGSLNLPGSRFTWGNCHHGCMALFHTWMNARMVHLVACFAQTYTVGGLCHKFKYGIMSGKEESTNTEDMLQSLPHLQSSL